MTFEYCIERVGLREGKLSKDPKDRGNYVSGKVGVGPVKGSKFGLSAMRYPKLDFDTLTWEQAREIYRQDYWNHYRIGEMAAVIRLYVLDSVINHETDGIRLLQRASGASVDGKIGNQTVSKSILATPLSFALTRSDHYVQITQNGFNDENDRAQLKGWMRRNIHVLSDTYDWIAANKP